MLGQGVPEGIAATARDGGRHYRETCEGGYNDYTWAELDPEQLRQRQLTEEFAALLAEYDAIVADEGGK